MRLTALEIKIVRSAYVAEAIEAYEAAAQFAHTVATANVRMAFRYPQSAKGWIARYTEWNDRAWQLEESLDRLQRIRETL